MRRFLRVVGVVSLFVLPWSGAALAESSGPLGGVMSDDLPVVCAGGLGYVAFGAHKTGDFCDSTADHGTSGSCKAQARAAALLVCAAGYSVSNLNCSVGQSCDSGNGHWCSCTYDCIKATVADPEPVEPHDGK